MLVDNTIHIKISLKTRQHNNREKKNKSHPGYHLRNNRHNMSIKLRKEQDSTNISYHNGSYHIKGEKESEK